MARVPSAAVRDCLLLLLLSMVAAACGETYITVRHDTDSRAWGYRPLRSASPITVVRFSDRRGEEGDHNPYRVGTIYIEDLFPKKVKMSTPWQRILAMAIAEGFEARGLRVVSEPDRELAYGSVFSTPFALTGEVRDFSVDSRFSTTAHIGAVVRLLDSSGVTVVERLIEDRAHRNNWGLKRLEDTLESALREALVDFVQKVIMHPEIEEHLTRRP